MMEYSDLWHNKTQFLGLMVTQITTVPNVKIAEIGERFVFEPGDVEKIDSLD